MAVAFRHLADIGFAADHLKELEAIISRPVPLRTVYLTGKLTTRVAHMSFQASYAGRVNVSASCRDPCVKRDQICKTLEKGREEIPRRLVPQATVGLEQRHFNANSPLQVAEQFGILRPDPVRGSAHDRRPRPSRVA